MVKGLMTWQILLVLCFALFALVERPCLVAGEETRSTQPVAQAATQTADADGDAGKHRWLTLGTDLRGRLEANTSINFLPGLNDTYYLSRLRLNVSIEANEWLRFFLQVQDSRAPGYSRAPVPGSVADPVDFHQGYVEFGRTEKGPWGFRVGRQELVFGNGRLIGNSNWGNVGRTFDAARLTYKKAGTQLDWFTSSVVVPVNGSFDRPHFNNKFHGCYTSFENLPSRPFTEVVELYFLVKTNSRARSELGPIGDLDLYTFGTRMNGKLPHNFDYRLEIPVQTGHRSRDRVRAWGGHWQLGYKPPFPEKAVRLAAEYNYASGDSNPRDGRDGTFDQLYPTSHDKLGTLDRIGWRNIHDLAGKMEWKLARKYTLNLEYHDFRLATRQDALYAKDGTPVVRNPFATSSRVGGEIDLFIVFQYSKHLELGSGFAHFFPGEYLTQSTGVDGASYPYLMWRYRL